MALYPVSSGTTAIASDVDQLVTIFNGQHDIGSINLAPQISAPSSGSFSLASQSGNSLGVGAYNYQFTYVTGQYKSDGTTLVQTGETTVSSALSITTTSGNTTVLVTLPSSGIPASAIAINIYRTSAGGSDYKLVATVKVGSANYSDSVADASRGNQTPPGSNTTGTYFNNPINSPVTWINLNVLQNGWVAYNGPGAYPAYRKDIAGNVWIKGTIMNGTSSGGTLICTLPAGFRPKETRFFTGWDGALAPHRLKVDPNGNISIPDTLNSNVFLTIDDISFPAEQ